MYYDIIRIYRQLEKPAIERLILNTPTGSQRNLLCDAQIHIIAAVALLNHAAGNVA